MSRAALEAQLRADLDSWELWLVYGDLLSQQGDERGELVRLSHQRRMLSRAARDLLWDECRALEERYHSAPLPEGVSAEWRCGFLTELRFAQVLDPDAPPYVASHADIVGTVSQLLDRGRSPLLASLDLRETRLTDETLASLVRLPAIRQVCALHLQRNSIGAAGVRALAESPYLRDLVTLDLRYNAIEEEGARALAGSPHLGRLHTLHLYRDDIGEEGALALASSPYLPLSLRRFWRGR